MAPRGEETLRKIGVSVLAGRGEEKTAALFGLVFPLQGNIALPWHTAHYTQQHPPQHPLATHGEAGVTPVQRAASAFQSNLPPNAQHRTKSRLQAILKIFLNHLGASAEGIEPLLTHQTHPSGEVCLWQPAEPSPDVPGFSPNALQEHPMSVPSALPNSICFF